MTVVLDGREAELTLGVGEMVRVAGRDLTISFTGVPQDSRCPSDARCVWQGDAEVDLVIATARGRERTILHTTLEPRAIQRAGLVVEVIGVSPAPQSDRRIPAEAYRVRLRLRQG